MTIREGMELYISSVKVGALTFGGGYAMLPILQREAVDNKGWNTEEELMDYYALAQCLPGIIMVNTMGFVGQKRGGRIGTFISSLGSITPSVVIIVIIAGLLTRFADLPVVQNAFAGIRVCVCVLILNSILKLWKSAVIDRLSMIIFLGVGLGSLLLNVSPIVFVLIAAGLGIAFHLLGIKKNGIGGREEGDQK